MSLQAQTISVTGGTPGEPVISSSSTGPLVNSSAWLDATAFAGTGTHDSCDKISQALTQASAGQVVDARGFTGTQACATNPIPSTAQSALLLGPAIFQLQATWVVPLRFTILGIGWDANPPTGVGATTLQACSAIAGNCTAVFPPAPGGPLLCWGAGGSCSSASGPIFDSNVEKITLDCKGVFGCIGAQDFNAEEGSGLRHVKIENWANGGRGLEISGSNFSGNVGVTNNSPTVTGSGFTSDLLNSQIQFASQAGVNYIVSAVNSAGTQLTLASNYNGTTNASTALIENSAGAQNGSFTDLYFVVLSSSTCTTSAVAILQNTGSASNEGPKFIREVTLVNACSSNNPTNAIEISGTGTAIEDVHACEAFTNCIAIGLDANTSDINVWNSWSSAISAASSSEVLISNAHTTTNIGLYGIRCVSPNLPTNIIKDQVNSNTITTASEAQIAMYVIGPSGNVITSSSSVPSSFFGLRLTAVGDHITSGAANKDLAGTCTMAAGACTAVSFQSMYTSVPSCTASWTGTGILTGLIKALAAASSLNISSSVNTDTAKVSYICVGNPN
jgi:hypothetical protein